MVKKHSRLVTTPIGEIVIDHRRALTVNVIKTSMGPRIEFRMHSANTSGAGAAGPGLRVFSLPVVVMDRFLDASVAAKAIAEGGAQ